jgi:hypothetical protein
MSLHINRFIDRVRSAEHRGQRDFVMTMAEARDLQADLTKILLALHATAQTAAPTTDSVEIDGGAF